MAASSWGSAACDSLMVSVAFGRHRNCFQSLLRSQTLHCASPFSPSRRRGIRDLPAACWCTSSCGGSVVLAWRAASPGRAQRAVLAKAPCWPPRPGSRRPHACASSAVRSHISPARCLSVSGILLAVRSQSEGRATRNVPSYIRSHCPPLSRTALCTCVLILIPLKCSAYLSLCPYSNLHPPPLPPESISYK